MQGVVFVLVLAAFAVYASPVISNKENKSLNEIVATNFNQNLENITPTITKSFLEAPLPTISTTSRKLQRSNQVEARKKKFKLIKKAFMPIIIFVLVKALVFIPLALGLLAFKAWNAIQLSFVSFVAAAALAIWKFCTKVNHEEQPLVHGGWELDRADPHLLAYAGYVPH